MIANREYKHSKKQLILANRLKIAELCKQNIEHISQPELAFAILLVQQQIPFSFNSQNLTFTNGHATHYAVYQPSTYTPDFVIVNNGRTIVIEIKGFKDPLLNFWYRQIDIALHEQGVEFYILKQDKKRRWVLYNKPTQEFLAILNRLL